MAADGVERQRQDVPGSEEAERRWRRRRVSQGGGTGVSAVTLRNGTAAAVGRSARVWKGGR